MSAFARHMLPDPDVRLPVNSADVLELFQRIRRERPQYTDEMNLLIDAMSSARGYSFALDEALADYWSAKQ